MDSKKSWLSAPVKVIRVSRLRVKWSHVFSTLYCGTLNINMERPDNSIVLYQ